jgi:phage tail sheath protein FI
VDTSAPVYQAAAAYCQDRRALLLIDPPASMTVDSAQRVIDGLGIPAEDARNAALYFPRLRQPDPTAENRLKSFVPSGAVAGVMARTDSARGVWKAPAGIDAGVAGAADLEQNVTDGDQDRLNPIAVNCLRSFPIIGRVVWGARTLRGADILADEWKYVPIRRLALYIEESLYRGTQWVVFEPNDEPLWAQIRLNVGAFMQNLFRQGAFEGTSPRDAYFVKCDRETTTPNDQNLGRVNILVGFAPLKPAEFVILQIQQIARAQA